MSDMAHPLTSLGLCKDEVNETLEQLDAQAIDRGEREVPLNKVKLHSSTHHTCPYLDHSHDFPKVSLPC